MIFRQMLDVLVLVGAKGPVISMDTWKDTQTALGFLGAGRKHGTEMPQ